MSTTGGYYVPPTATAQNPGYGLSLGELLEWAQAARRDGADLDAPITVTTNLGARIKGARLVVGPELARLRAKHRRTGQ